MYKQCKRKAALVRQRKLEELFLEYLQQVPFEQVEIKSFCLYIGVDRKTFYRHFHSKEDILWALIDHRVMDATRHLEQNAAEPALLQEDLASYFQFWKDQRAFLDTMTENNLEYLVLERASCHSYFGITAKNSGEEDSEINMILRFIVLGIMSMVLHWHEYGYRRSIDYMVNAALLLLEHPLASYYGYFKSAAIGHFSQIPD